MKKFLLFLLLSTAAYASNSAVTATVTDTDGQLWINGTWNAKLTLPSGPFGNVTPTVGGVPVIVRQGGSIDANGVINAVLTDTGSLDQSGGQWTIQVCPNSSVSEFASTGCATVTTAITGATVDISSRFSGVVAPRFPAGPTAYGYSDIEVFLPSIPGLQYFNTGAVVANAGLRVWDGKRWKGVGGGGGGGGYPPSAPNYSVQGSGPGQTSFTSDSGITINPSTHTLTGQITNGAVNADSYTNGGGNNGIANAFASTACTVNCVVVRPPTSTDTESSILPPTGSTLVDNQSSSATTVKYNPPLANVTDKIGGTPNCHSTNTAFCNVSVFDTQNPFATTLTNGSANVFWNSTAFHGWSVNYGNAPGIGTAWTVHKIHQDNVGFYGQGITQLYGANVDKYAAGDDAGMYFYNATDGGTPDYSGEGHQNMTLQGGQHSSYFHGIVGSGATTGTTSLPITYNSGFSPSNINRNQTTGAITDVIDITKGTISGTVTGLDVAIAGVAGARSMPVSASVTPTTTYGSPGCTMPQPVSTNANISGSITCTFTILGGSSGVFTTGLAELSGDFPELVNITAVGALSGGTQSVTLTYLHPHGQAQTTLWQGSSVIGQYLSYDKYFAEGGFRAVHHIYGAIDSTHLAVQLIFTSANNPYQAPLAITNLTKSGTTLTMIPSATIVANGFATFDKIASGAYVTGCSDSSLNAALTNVSVNYQAFTLTAGQAAGGTSCPSAFINYPAAYFGFHLYPGAEVYGPSITAPANLPIGINNVAWVPGDLIEIPFHPAWVGGDIKTYYTINNPLPSSNSAGEAHFYSGNGIGGNFVGLTMGNLDPCANYVGCGGTMTVPTMFRIGGYGQSSVHGNLMSVDETPLNGQASFYMGLPDAAIGGISNTSPQVFAQYGFPNSYLFYRPDIGAWGAFNIVAGSPSPGASGSNYGTFTGAGFNVTSTLDAPVPSGIRFLNNTASMVNEFGICNSLDHTNAVTIGVCAKGNIFQSTSTGQVNVPALRVDTSASVASLSVGLSLPIYAPSPVYTGTAGSTLRIYQYSVVSPLGVEGSTGDQFNVNNTAATLDGADYVTFTCPVALQPNYPAGSTYRIRQVTGTQYLVGTCPIGGTLVDNTTVATSTPPVLTANQSAVATQWQVGAGGAVAFWNSNYSGGALDAFLSRSAAGTVNLGTTLGATNGTFHTGTGTFDTALTVAGQPVCQLNGTNCPASSSLPSGTANQMLYYAAPGTAVTPLTLGTNLSITGGVLNASATAATNFNALTSGTNTTAAMLVGAGASLGTTSTGTIAATTAANLSGTPALPNGTTATTQTVGDNSTKLATTAFVIANAAGSGNTTSTSLTTNCLTKANGPNSIISSALCDDGTTATYTGTGGMKAASFTGTGTTPTAFSLPAGTGSIPALPANSGGFAAPVTGGTAYLIKLPATITAGIPHYAAPATGDGVNESAMTVSKIALADLSATGTPSSTTYLRGDNTWATVTASVTFPWSCQPGLGDGLNAITAGTYLQTSCYNDTGQTVTLTGVRCYADAGTPTMNVTNGAGTGLLTGAVTCSTSFASGTQSGTTTIAAGDYLKFTFVASGTAKQATFVVTGTHP